MSLELLGSFNVNVLTCLCHDTIRNITRNALYSRGGEPVKVLLLSIPILTSPMWFCQQDGVCDKASAPSVSSISRLLRGPANQTRPGDDPRRNHSINGILGASVFLSLKWHSLNYSCNQSNYPGETRTETWRLFRDCSLSSLASNKSNQSCAY